MLITSPSGVSVLSSVNGHNSPHLLVGVGVGVLAGLEEVAAVGTVPGPINHQ